MASLFLFGKSGTEQLATKIGTKKSYISRVENGHADIQVSTLFIRKNANKLNYNAPLGA